MSDKIVDFGSPFLRIEDLAKREGVSVRTMYRRLAAGRLESRTDEQTGLTVYRLAADWHDTPADTTPKRPTSDAATGATANNATLIAELTADLAAARAALVVVTEERDWLRDRLAERPAWPNPLSWIKRVLSALGVR